MLASSFMDWRAFRLDLPAADATPIVVKVLADGRYCLGGLDVDPKQLAERVRLARDATDARPVVIQAAAAAPVQATIRALDRLQAGGVEGASLAGDPG